MIEAFFEQEPPVPGETIARWGLIGRSGGSRGGSVSEEELLRYLNKRVPIEDNEYVGGKPGGPFNPENWTKPPVNWSETVKDVFNHLYTTPPAELFEEFFNKAQETDGTVHDPIMLDLNGDGIKTTKIYEGVYFDYGNDGFAEESAWVDSNDGILVVDKNNDGIINDESELLTANSLAAYNTSIDWNIDANDANFSEIKVLKGDGNLATLSDLDIKSISLSVSNTNITDENGNTQLAVGSYTKTDGTVLSGGLYNLQTDPAYSIATEWLDVPDDIAVLPDVSGYGTIYTLHQTMVRDTSGTLESLVQSFVNSQDNTERRSLVNQILYKWTGSEGIDPTSRGSYVNAQHLAVVEAFKGQGFISSYNGSSAPLESAGNFLEMAYIKIQNMVYARLMSQSHLNDLFSERIPTWNDSENSITYDLTNVITDLQSRIAADPTAGKELVVEFANALKGLGLDSSSNYKNILDPDCYYNVFTTDDRDLRWQLDIIGKALTTISDPNGGYGDAKDNAMRNYGSNAVCLDALSGDDVLYGGDGNDTLYGCTGNDALDGGNGDDTLYAGSGDDVLYGGAGYDMNSGGIDNDILYGESGNDSLYGDENNDTLYGGEGNDLLSGGENNDILYGGIGDDSLYGDTGNDVLYGEDGNDLLSGGIDNDTLYGGAGNDSLYGDQENDALYGGDGNDGLWGGLGDDYIDGGNGNDHIDGSIGNDTLIGGNGDDVLYGFQNDDVLDGGTGKDTMYGCDGDDTYIFEREYGQDIILDSTYETSGILINSGKDTIQFGDNITQNDLLFIKDQDNLIIKIDGTDDQLTIYSQFDSNCAIENFKFADGTILSNQNINSLLQPYGTDGNDLLYGDNRDNYITGGEGNDVIHDGEGNDTIIGGAGADTMIGGLGDDTYYVDSSSDIITEYVDSGIDTVYSSVSYTLRSYIENLYLTGSDNINGKGNSSNNIITGNSGDNILDGSSGTDTLIGGEGNDIYVVDNIGDVITEYAGDGIDTVTARISYTLADNIENLTLLGGKSAIGNDLDNILTGSAGSNILYGKAGDDTMIGGLGNDTYYVDSKGDVITENLDEGTDLVNSSISYTLGSNFEKLTLIGTDDLNATGNELNNTIRGNDGNNIIDGGLGNDTMYGELGDDTYYVDSSSDIITEYADSGNDTVYSSVSYTLRSYIESLYLTGSDNINAKGNSSNNIITGNSGDNTLDGYSGIDTMMGGLGNDTYLVDNIGDAVTETIGEGIDTVISKVSYTLSDNVENLTLLGGKSATGNDLDNAITGNSGGNTIYGFAGNDTIIGGNGNDTIDGGIGDDLYTGYISGFGNDSIKDSGGLGDSLDLSEYIISNAVFTAIDTSIDSDTNVDSLKITLGTDSILLYNYFNNFNKDEDLCATGSGYVEDIHFNDGDLTLAQVQSIIK